MKNKFWIFITLALVVSACQREDYFDDLDPATDSFQEDDAGNDTDDSNDHPPGDHDHGSDNDAPLTTYRITGDDIDKIKDHNVAPQYQSFQQDYAKHIEMWEFVTRLLPFEIRGRLAEFEVFHGEGELLGYVAPINDNDLSRWKFALAIDAANNLDEINFKDFFTYVVIHEYGHVLTLNEEEVNTNFNNCNTFEIGEGCPRTNSYINQNFLIGWDDIYDEFQLLQEEELFDFYDKYQDRFSSDYAATNPGEDVAEVFAFFITSETPPNGNSIADQKIKSMYNQPDLVELRNKIRQSPTVRALRAGSWLENPLRNRFKIGKHQHTTVNSPAE